MIKDAIYVDVETTGIDPMVNKIVQISMTLNGKTWTTIVNPETLIPEETTRLHKLRDEDVKSAPTFKEVAKIVYGCLKKAKYFVAYNASFDFSMIQKHLADCGYKISQDDFIIIDPMMMHKFLYDNTLSSVYKFYTGKDLEGAHDASADVKAMIDIIDKQLEYPQFKDVSPEKLPSVYNKGIDQVLGKWFCKNDKSQYIFKQGKHNGVKLSIVVLDDPKYLTWILGLQDLTYEERNIIENSMDIDVSGCNEADNDFELDLDF